MDKIRELLNNLAALSAEDLESLKGLIIAEFQKLDGEESPDLALIDELANAGDQVMAQANQLAADQAAAEQARAAARERINALNPPAETEDAADETAPAADGEDAADPAAEIAEAAEAVTAAGRQPSKVARMAARQAPARPSPENRDAEPATTALVASGSLYGTPAGTQLDKETLAEAMTRALSRMGRPQGPSGSSGTDVIVASASWASQYPEERRLAGDDMTTNDRKIRQAIEPDALVATGGICGPVNVDWTINTIATADRPMREAFPTFQASRGGLIYRPDLDLGTLGNATGIWTEAMDAAPAGATKPVYQVTCPTPETTYVQAISTRLQFGNMMSRFDPETVAANTNLAMAAAARVADNNLLNLVAAQCTQGVTTSQVLGATRDIIMAIGQCVAAFRNLHRVPRSQTLRVCFPDWFKELLRIDLARETAHQQDDQWNSLAITDEQIMSLFQPYNVTPIWHIDGQTTASPGLSGAVNQVFTTQSTGAINTFPTEVVWYIWYEGAFVFLDGGQLDLGVVRDSLLDSTNDYETFVEIFEALAYRGFPGGALQFISHLCANGGSAGTVSTAASCA